MRRNLLMRDLFCRRCLLFLSLVQMIGFLFVCDASAGYTKQTYPVGDGARAIAVGDLNGDDIQDIVTGNETGYDVSVLLGNGDGSYQPAVSYAVEMHCRDVAIGDMNADENPDLVTVNGFRDVYISILLGNGDGTFQPAVPYEVEYSSYLALGDLDGDENLDVVALGDDLNVFLGNGDGSLQNPTVYTGGGHSIALRDLDGDEDLDLIKTYGSVSVALGNGDGTFGTWSHYYTGSGYRATIGDFNGDDRLDVATVESGVNEYASVILGNGDGTFQPPSFFGPIGEATDPRTSIATGDMDGDGDQDLAVSHGDISGRITLLLGNGEGSFRVDKTYSVTFTPSDLAIGQLDGSGDLDMAVVHYGPVLTVLLATEDSPTPPLFRAPVNYRTGDGATSMVIGTLDGDSALDLAVANADSNNVSVLLGNGNGTFQSAVNYPARSGGYFDRPLSIAMGDLDGSGSQDLAVATMGDPAFFEPGSLGVLLGNGDGTYQPVLSQETGMHPSSVAVTSLNGDAHADVVVANAGRLDQCGVSGISVFLGNGDGTFSVGAGIPGDCPNWVAAGDLDGDGEQDLAVTHEWMYVDDPFRVMIGNGDGSFQAAVDYAAGIAPVSVTIGELNGDANPDLVVTGEDAQVLLGNGDGTFQTAVSYGVMAGPCSVAIGDLDGDETADLAVANKDSNAISILFGNGDGTFQPALNYAAGNQPKSVVMGDLNGDGCQDLALANEGSGNVSVLINLCGQSPPQPWGAASVIGEEAYRTQLGAEYFFYLIAPMGLILYLKRLRRRR